MAATQVSAALGSLATGRGAIAVVEGEPGIGKTTLAESALGSLPPTHKVVRVRCVPSRLSPLYELVEGLGSAGLGMLVADRPPRLEALYVMTPGGLLAARAERPAPDGERSVDADIFSGMLTAVEQFMADSMGDRAGGSPDGSGGLNTLGYRGYRVLILRAGASRLVAMISGTENEFLRDDLEEVARRIVERFGPVLDTWDGTAAALEGLEAELRALFDSGRYEGLEAAEDEPRLRRERLYSNIVRGLRREARRAGLVLFIDDAQWADEGTVALLQPLGLATVDEPLAILLTVRPGEAPEHLVTGLQRLTREARVTRVALERRDTEEIARILGSRMGAFETVLAARIRDEGDGNPLYCLEIARYLMERGMLESGPHGFRARKDAQFELPAKARDIILARVSNLSVGERRALDLAAALGDRFDPKVVAHALGPAASADIEALDKRHRLLRPTSTGMEFDHAWTRDAVHESLGDTRRASLHAQAARSIEALFGEDEKRAAEVAEHWRLAGEADRARVQFRRAARVASARYENEAAAAALRASLSLAPDAEREGILQELAQVLEAAGRYEECERVWAELVGIAEAAGDFRKVAERKTRLGSILSERRFEHERAAELFDSAANLSEMEGDGLGTARVEFARGAMQFLTGKLAEAETTVSAALDRARGLGMGEVELAQAKNWLAAVRFKTGRHESALAILTECVAAFRAAKMDYRVAVMYHNMGLLRKDRGELDKAMEVLTVSLKMAERVGSIGGVALARFTRSLTQFARERFAEALEDAEKAVELFRLTGEPGGEWKAEASAADALFALGRHEDGLRRAGRAVDMARVHASKRELASVLGYLGRFLARGGDHAGASAALGEAETLAPPDPSNRDGRILLFARLEASLEADQVDTASRTVARLQEAEAGMLPAEVARLLEARARIAVLRGESGPAAELAERARQRFGELRLPVSEKRAAALAASAAASLVG